MDVKFFCPVCLHYDHGEETSSIECSFCRAQMKSSGMKRGSSYNSTRPFVEALKAEPEFNERLYKARIAEGNTPEHREKLEQVKREMAERRAKVEAMQREIRYGKQAEGEVHCPYCNSTQIQLVRRKWSLLAGFATNKVDRVCVNCKKKF